jgi:3-dehydroquinate dehydratase
VLHSRTKHIEVRYHFLRDNVEKGNIDRIHVPTEKQLADILTNPLGQATFAHLRGDLGVVFSFLSFGWEG